MKTCQIDGCEITAKYYISNYGHEMYVCWKHLKEFNTPENDPNVVILGHAEGFETFQRMAENFDKRMEELK